MATIIAKGKAQIDGIVGTFNVFSPVPTPQTARCSTQGEEQTEKDNLGFDNAWRVRNLRYETDVTFLLQGTTAANAIASGAVVAPLTKVTLSGFDLAVFNGDWQLMLGQEWDLGNTKAATMNVKLRRYADATQNTLAGTTPS